MKTITITNQKGGAGKTSTALALAAGLSLRGYSVLSIDLDAQSNMTFTMGARTDGPTSLDLLTGEVKAGDAIQHTETGDIIPASTALSGADSFITGSGKEYRLSRTIEPIGQSYDYLILDTPPALGILTVNALTACDSVIIPAQADIYSLQGIEHLAETIGAVREYCNRELVIEGILLTRYSPRAILRRDVADLARQLADRLGTKVFKTTIRDSVVVGEAQISQDTIFHHAPRAKVTRDYERFISELTGKER